MAVEERGGSVVECLARDRGVALFYVVSLSKTLYPLISTGSTQEDPSRHNRKKCRLGPRESTQTRGSRTLNVHFVAHAPAREAKRDNS